MRFHLRLASHNQFNMDMIPELPQQDIKGEYFMLQ